MNKLMSINERARVPVRPALRVYMAGPVIEEPVNDEEAMMIHDWRDVVFESDSKHGGSHEDGETLEYAGQEFEYAGPNIETSGHGMTVGSKHSADNNQRALVERCLRQVVNCDLMFAWIDRENTPGTVTEIGAALAMKKPIFIAFAKETLVQHFYFPAALATTIVTSSIESAWEIFASWARCRHAMGE